jgi:hypothetical protein
MEAAGTAEDGFRTPMKASATYMDICGCRTGEGRVVGDVNGTGAFETEGLKHALIVIDR